MGLGLYVRSSWKDRELRRNAPVAVKAMGPEGVAYLVRQMERDPIRELLIKISPSMPAGIAKLLPDERAYKERRNSAAGLLPLAGTNAIRALPAVFGVD